MQWNNKIKTASGILRLQATIAPISVEAFCLLSTHPIKVHVVTQTSVKGRPASERSKPAATFATDRDESNNIRLSYKGTAGHIPKEPEEVKPSASSL